MARAGELGVDQALSFLREVDAINLRRRDRAIDLARELTEGTFAGTRVAVFGAAFKPNSDDIRDSPALDVAARLHRQGAAVTVYDPQAIENARRYHPDLTYAEDAFTAARDADVVLMLTEWTAATRSTRCAGDPAAGTTARWAARELCLEVTQRRFPECSTCPSGRSSASAEIRAVRRTA
jgi:UDP-glucose 6-dehydrogenase